MNEDDSSGELRQRPAVSVRVLSTNSLGPIRRYGGMLTMLQKQKQMLSSDVDIGVQALLDLATQGCFAVSLVRGGISVGLAGQLRTCKHACML